MKKFTEETKAQGIDLPPVFKELDVHTGLPTILTVKESEQDSAEEFHREIEAVMQKAEDNAQKEVSLSPLPSPSETKPPFQLITYETNTQTEILITEEKPIQTFVTETIEVGIQSFSSVFDVLEESVQTPVSEFQEIDQQTDPVSVREEIAQTTEITNAEASQQTSIIQMSDEELQTFSTETFEADTETEKIPIADVEMQTDHIEEIVPPTDFRGKPEVAEAECQTEEAESSKIAQMGITAMAAQKFKKAFTRKKKTKDKAPKKSSPVAAKEKQPQLLHEAESEGQVSPEEQTEELAEELAEEQAEGTAEETEMESESEGSLQWDPVDGMHAEKQKAVKDLRKMFDTK